MFARFDENTAMTLRVIKETKRYGRTDARTDGRTHGQRENSITPTNKVCGGYKNDVDLLTSQCASLLYNAADVTGLIKSSNSVVSSNLGRRTRRNITRPWFDHECRRMQLKYRRIKNLRRRVSDIENYQALNDASKDYKKCLHKHFTSYKKDFIKKLRGLKNSDPKAYWKMLNKFDGSKHDTAQKLSLEVFAEHFK